MVFTAEIKYHLSEEMAKQLLMNPNTISKAYQVLETEKVLVTSQRQGTFVRAIEETPRDEIRIQN